MKTGPIYIWKIITDFLLCGRVSFQLFALYKLYLASAPRENGAHFHLKDKYRTDILLCVKKSLISIIGPQ